MRFLPVLFLILPFVLRSQDNPNRRTEDIIDSLIQLNRNLIGKRDIAGSWVVICQAKQLADSLLDPASPLAGRCLFNYGRTLHHKEDFIQAEAYYQQALLVQRKNTVAYAEDLAGTLNAFAYLYSLMARYADAEALYYEALAIRKATLGDSHPDYAMSVNNLGSLFLTNGNLNEAERYFVEALGLRKEILGETHTDYAWSLNNLGVLYKRMGKYKRAEELYLQARDIWTGLYGPKHILVATTMNNLANLYQETNRYAEAEAMYLQRLDIVKDLYGPEHSSVANGKHNLAKLYQKTGRFMQAEALFNEAIGIWKAKGGDQHPLIAEGMHNLGLLYMEEGQYLQARTAMETAKGIRMNQLGTDHPDYGNSANGLGQLYWQMGKHEDAALYLKEAALLQKKLLGHAVKHLTETEQGDYADRFLEIQDLYYSYARDFGGQNLELAETCYDLVLFLKGYVLEAAQVFRQKVNRSPESQEVFKELLFVRKKWGEEMAKPMMERKGLENLETKAEHLEKQLLRQVGPGENTAEDITWAEVKKQLKPGEGAIEFIHFRYRHPYPADSVFYAAVVIRSDGKGPVIIPLFEEAEIKPVLLPEGARRSDYVNRLYTYPDRGLVEQTAPTTSLYDLIWKQLEEHPGGVKGLEKIYFSMSGLLHRINLGAIAINDEQSLSDRYDLVQLGSTRAILTDHIVPDPVKEAVLFGGINYDLDSLVILAARQGEDQSLLVSRGEQSVSTMDQTLRQGSWSFLKWTEKESSSISKTLEEAGMVCQSYTDHNGTEEAFKSLENRQNGSPGMIHMATHGYFFPDPDERQEEQTSEVVFQLSANPMIRSGLILAGGNYIWSGHRPFSNREDGILTAYEISQMDLSSTQLVVLSACETGLGDIKGNEGVYGLQRAFKIAGVQYLIMSLWQVPDRETMQFMTTFYQNWLAGSTTIPDAFRKTQMEMRDRFYNPYSWAGFILVD